LQHLDILLRLTQELRQTFSDQVVKAAVLFEHGCSIMPRDFVNIHGNLDDTPIQCAKRIKQFVELGGLDAVRTPYSG
jgi:hypothetical protein